jgi:hypothetical protein
VYTSTRRTVCTTCSTELYAPSPRLLDCPDGNRREPAAERELFTKYGSHRFCISWYCMLAYWLHSGCDFTDTF